jgi:hypothetical protein
MTAVDRGSFGWRCPSRPSTTRVVEWLEGDAAWEIIDQLSTRYTGQPYPRGQERVVAVIEPERHSVGIG